MNKGLTRRAATSALFGSYVLWGRQAPRRPSRSLPQVGEFTRLVDPLTENIVVRITYPSYDSYLPAPTSHFISARERILVYSSNRHGPLAPCEIDLHAGRSRQLATAEHLVPASLSLDEHERALYFLDGRSLEELSFPKLRERSVANNLTAFALPRGTAGHILGVTHTRLQWTDSARPLATDVNVPTVSIRPGGAGCFFVREQSPTEHEFWYVQLSPVAAPTLLAKGDIWNPIWNPDGKSLLFLRALKVNGVSTSEIYEVPMEADGKPGPERPVCRTSQFAAFAPNGDGSVFIGASRSKAQPAIVLLLRSTQRELTLCEHRSTNPRSVSPVFSPDSRRVYFQSDREGRSVLYAVNVERLVEPTP